MNQKLKLSELEKALKKSWSAKTSSSPNWNSENPSLGQCAVSALIVQDYFGGKIVWAEVGLLNGKKESHYFNKIYGKQKDLTKEQFPKGTYIPKGVPKLKDFTSTRDYVLSYPATAKRYNLLKEVVKKMLDQNKLNN